MIPYIKDIGERIEQSWIRQGYDERPFSDIVLDTLADYPPHLNLSVDDIIEWTFGAPQDPKQPSPPKLFGEPPVLLFQSPRFYIEALFWRSGTTDIHQHAFSGVFAVLAGSSVHSHWNFETERMVNQRMLSGRLSLKSTETLRPGDMRPISAGNQLIHQLFHLELPSVTLVIRTYREPPHMPQYKYLSPGLAIDPFAEDPLQQRRLIFIEAMARGQIDGLSKYAEQWISGGDIESMYYLFSALSRRRIDPNLVDELYALARKQHGDIIDLFREVCDEMRRTRFVLGHRADVADKDARFLLALFMLMPDKENIFNMLRIEFPGTDPLEFIDQAMAKMPGKEIFGFDYSGAHRLIFRSLVEGVDEEGIMGRLSELYSRESLEKQRQKLTERVREIARSELFHPLMSEGSMRVEHIPKARRTA